MKRINAKNLTALLSSDKARTVFVIVGLCAVFLIFLSSQLSTADDTTDYTYDLSAAEYCDSLSLRLTDMIESIDGAGETRVLLTLDSSYEYVYLDDDKTLTKILEPAIRGVAVLCTGGDDPVIKEKITQMLTTLLSVSSGSISVSKLI